MGGLDADVELAVERVDAETDKWSVLGKRALGGRAANHSVFDVFEMRNADRHRTGPAPWESLVLPPIVPQWRLFTMSLTSATLRSAADGFDHFFAGSIDAARQAFEKNAEDPYHQLGLAVCSFLEAAMSMEVGPCHVTLTRIRCSCAGCPLQTADAARAESSITESLRLATKYRQSAQPQRTSRFPTGLEWDVLIADATLLSGLVHIFRSVATPLLQPLPLIVFQRNIPRICALHVRMNIFHGAYN